MIDVFNFTIKSDVYIFKIDENVQLVLFRVEFQENLRVWKQ